LGVNVQTKFGGEKKTEGTFLQKEGWTKFRKILFYFQTYGLREVRHSPRGHLEKGLRRKGGISFPIGGYWDTL